VAAILAQVVEEQSGQQRFADTSIGASDENSTGPDRCHRFSSLSIVQEKGIGACPHVGSTLSKLYQNFTIKYGSFGKVSPDDIV